MFSANNSKDSNLLLLVVEDDDFLSDAYRLKFQQANITIKSARDGESGLQLIKQQQPALVILDLMLPKMDGLEVLRALRQDESTKNIMVIIASNFPDRQHKEECFKLGVIDFFVKSETSISELVETCKKLLTE